MDSLQKQLIQAIEHTCLKPYATSSDIHQLCQEAVQWNFYGVCIAGIWVEEARQCIGNSSPKIVTVAGFPTGAVPTRCKCFEVEQAIKSGADEVDFVLNIGWTKEGRFVAVENEFKQILAAAGKAPLKVILETCFLSDSEKEWVCKAAAASGIAFVKTSTGFGTGGATSHDVRLMHQFAPNVKASGGIKDAQSALELLQAGATRLGTSSGVAILKAYSTNP